MNPQNDNRPTALEAQKDYLVNNSIATPKEKRTHVFPFGIIHLILGTTSRAGSTILQLFFRKNVGFFKVNFVSCFWGLFLIRLFIFPSVEFTHVTTCAICEKLEINFFESENIPPNSRDLIYSMGNYTWQFFTSVPSNRSGNLDVVILHCFFYFVLILSIVKISLTERRKIKSDYELRQNQGESLIYSGRVTRLFKDLSKTQAQRLDVIVFLLFSLAIAPLSSVIAWFTAICTLGLYYEDRQESKIEIDEAYSLFESFVKALRRQKSIDDIEEQAKRKAQTT